MLQPDQLIDLLAALLADRPMCFACIGERIGQSRQATGALVDHLGQTIQVFRHDTERCQTCGAVGETVSFGHRTTT